MFADFFQRLIELQPFSKLSTDDLKRIASSSILRSYPAGEFILHEGDESQAAYFLLSGKVEVIRSALSGREQVLALLVPGQGFNTAPFFLEENQNPASVRCLERSEILVLPGSQFVALLAEIPAFNRMVMKDYSQRLKLLANKVEDLGLHSVRARLVRFLLAQADQERTGIRWTQDEIARHVGTVRDVVGRSLRNLEAEGLIRMQRQVIRLLDRTGLEKIADEN
jgi:CRP/FNR family transcriptional regulator, cyclic AMP receptor protein